LEYLITPVPKPRMTRSDAWKKRKCVLDYWAFKDEVRAHGVILPVPYKITFYIGMPKSWPKYKKLELNGAPHLQTPDKDNLEKALLDAVFDDDKHIWSGWVEKRWRDVPGILVEEL
jgi:Holliday junction resolvase RusA-like endonuclease